MLRFLLGLARFTLSAWLGAAMLFVVTGVREVRAPELDSTVRDVLVSVRFPAYYAFGFALVGTAWMATLLAAWLADSQRGKWFCFAGIILAALVVMVGDYVWVYRPLVEMITPPGQSRPAEFLRYHEASKWVNLGSLTLCGIAALLILGQRDDG